MNDYVKSKWVYSLIGLVIIAMIIWIVTGTSDDDTDNDLRAAQETYTVEAAVQENSVQQTEQSTGYYFVRSEGDIVRVYWIDDSGEHLHRETTIAYPLLNVEDQKMLDEGVRLDSEEELASFLENYDS